MTKKDNFEKKYNKLLKEQDQKKAKNKKEEHIVFRLMAVGVIIICTLMAILGWGAIAQLENEFEESGLPDQIILPIQTTNTSVNNISTVGRTITYIPSTDTDGSNGLEILGTLLTVFSTAIAIAGWLIILGMFIMGKKDFTTK